MNITSNVYDTAKFLREALSFHRNVQPAHCQLLLSIAGIARECDTLLLKTCITGHDSAVNNWSWEIFDMWVLFGSWWWILPWQEFIPLSCIILPVSVYNNPEMILQSVLNISFPTTTQYVTVWAYSQLRRLYNHKPLNLLSVSVIRFTVPRTPVYST